MHEDLPFDESDLSEEDLAVLRAFDAIENWDSSLSQDDSPSSASSRYQSPSPDESEDMLTIFLVEMEEDLAGLLQAFKSLSQEGQNLPAHFVALQRLGHKIRGAAGTAGYPRISEIAGHIEIIAEQVVHHMVPPDIGYKAIMHAITVLEFAFNRLAQSRQESVDNMLIVNLRALYSSLSIDLDQPIAEPEQKPEPAHTAPPDHDLPPHQPGSSDPSPASTQPAAPAVQPEHIATSQGELALQPGYVHVETHHFDNLIHHTQKLFEQQALIEHAYRRIEEAFQALQDSQARFQRRESLLSTYLMREHLSSTPEEHTSSSLIKRILYSANANANASANVSARESTRSYNYKGKARMRAPLTNEWDELDIERYTDYDMLLRSLREAMVDTISCTARLEAAYGALRSTQQEYLMHTTLIRNDTLLMRRAPLKTIAQQLREVVMSSPLAGRQQLAFEMNADHIEIDQGTLALLAPLLSKILTVCTDSAPSDQKRQGSARRALSHRIWINARELSSEISIEVGFSGVVPGGAMQMLPDQMRQINGILSLRRNVEGGISFILRFPRTRGIVQCLLVRVSNQRLLIPLAYVQHVGSSNSAADARTYHLGALLGIPATYNEASEATAVVMIQNSAEPDEQPLYAILVDEIIDQVEMSVRPLPSYLQRPGITGTAIDAEGNVLLHLDIAGLVASYEGSPDQTMLLEQGNSEQPLKILVADDSASLRRSVRQTFRSSSYQVLEAEDGLKTLELMKASRPDILLLDIEMPYLNGYDLLSIARNDPRFSAMKIIMLTSRSSHKHQQHARDLGADAYLTKPYAQDTLLATIQAQRPQPALTNG